MFHQNFSHFGQSSVHAPRTLDEYKQLFGMTEEDINKALFIDGTLGQDVTPAIGESLDPVVHYITLNAGSFAPALRRLKTYEAKAHLEQFALVSSLGKSRWGGSAHREGDLGTFDSSKYERVTEAQRWFGQVGVVSRSAQRASSSKFGDLKKREAFDRLVKLLLDGEWAIWHGDPTLNPYMFTGLFAKMKAISNNQNIVSKIQKGDAGGRETYEGGGSLSAAEIRTYMPAASRFGGIHSACYMHLDEKVLISNQESGNMRWNDVKAGESRVEYGVTVDQLDNPLGRPADIVWSSFFTNGGRVTPYVEFDPTDSTKFHADAPIRPSAPTGAAAAGGKLPPNTYYYAIAFVNEKAEGPVGIQTTGYTADNTNGIINVTATYPSDVAKSHSIALYRSTTVPADGDDFSKFRFVKEVAIPDGAAPAGTLVIADDGTVIPGSRYAALVDESAISLPELLPPSFRDLADIDNTHRFSLDWEFSPLAHDKCLREVMWQDIGGSVADPA